jgi:hypothetical protein
MALRSIDLMIGDWVQNPLGWKAQVQSIRYVNTIKDEWEWLIKIGINNETFQDHLSLTEIEPIPLTPEILEKNVFRKQKWNDLVTEFVFAKDLEQTPQTVIQFTFYSREIEGVKSLLEMWTKSQFGHGQNDVHLCGVYYIHELQHALRLCGIEKEIEL